MTAKETLCTGRESAVFDEIENALRGFRKELSVLKKDPDADQAKIDRLKLEIRRLKVSRFLQKRQIGER